MKKEKKLKKRKSSNTEENSPSHNHLHANVHTLLLASLANLRTNFSARTLLTKCINNLHNQSLNPSKTLTLINNNLFLSLIPPLLRTTKSIPPIAERTAEIIGAISLQSFECNEKIASDNEILKALLDALVSSNKKVSMAACNAVLDLSTTSLAREKLCDINAVMKLM
ncbi:Bifunctional lysine-specific demethylase and histidyl-hydroxylase no66 [Thalictrum thalictroides]|uniref:Bifunctional lysine-specific demethylase and histidyl-hydroxylase no66 n=1 Tax=Thalictrum thalictroides TaxID=46969 RepID=A0A7J6US72_THATH|nr:Bifunctional lysine-specific demethylase and histidyl-hydroxylase no66 [Thalictrum thalictroides]